MKKIRLRSKEVKSKIAFGNSLGFQAEIEDLRLKCGILGDDSKNKPSGSSDQKRGMRTSPTSPW